MEFFSDLKLENTVEGYVSMTVPPEKSDAVGAPASPKRDFQKDVHHWNPQVPMWTRSPKE